MQKPTFRNFHKQKYTLLSKNMQRKNTVDNNPITLRNLGKCQGKPQCGETQRERERERERDLIIMLQESTKQQQIYISSQGKYLTAPNLSHRNLPRFSCQNRTVVQPLSVPRFPCPQSVVRTVPYGPKTTNRKQKSASKSVPKMPRFPCQIRTTVRTVWNLYGLYGSVQYGLPQQKNISAKNSQKFFSRESCPLSSKNVPSLLLTFLSQACSENLSNSPPDVLSTSSRCLHNMSCTLPNAFFYNLKMTFSPQKCLFTFPTLDPKAKIRSCLFQDQGS
jgi:hypothetical protein